MKLSQRRKPIESKNLSRCM